MSAGRLSTGGLCCKKEGEHYLEKLEDNFPSVAAVLKECRRPAELTMCVGISTSYDKLRSARQIEEYLTMAQRCGVQGRLFRAFRRCLSKAQGAK